MVKGKPAYQVGTSRQDDGLQAAEGTGNGSSKKEEPEEDKDLPGLLANIVLVILYGGFFLYLLLELQRAIRVQIRRRQKEMENGEIAEYYVNAFRELVAVAGVRIEEMTSSEQFFDAIRKHFLEVPERWYRRSMEILQRAKFGGKNWHHMKSTHWIVSRKRAAGWCIKSRTLVENSGSATVCVWKNKKV